MRNTGFCDFQPFTSVECQLRAENSAGYSGIVSRTATTQCDSKDVAMTQYYSHQVFLLHTTYICCQFFCLSDFLKIV